MAEAQKLLVVDDDDGTRKTLGLILANMGYGVEMADTGHSALEQAKQKRFDLALVDLRLPDMEGVELIAPLKEACPDIVVIMATAYASIQSAVDALNQGAVAYIQKPLRMDEVLAIVREALEKQQLAREKVRAEQALAESEARYRSLVELSPDAVAIESRGRLVFVNQAGARLLGADEPEQLTGKRMLDLVHPECRAAAKARARRARKGERPPLSQEKFVRLDGSVIDVEVAAGPASHQGKPAVLMIVRDITERKRAEEQLWQSIELFERTFMNQRDAIVIFDAGSPPRAVDCNPATMTVLGYSREEMLGQPLEALVSEEENGPFLEMLQGAVRDAGYVHASGQAVWRRDGATFPADLYVAPLKDKRGQGCGWVCVVRDVTERKRAEEALQASESRFRELAELLPGIVFEMNADGELTFVNRMGFEAFAYAEEDSGQGVNALDVVVPEDRPRASADLAMALAGEGVVTAEYTVLRKDGETFPVIVYANRVAQGSEGVGVRGIVIDLTDQKRLEATVRHQDRLAAVGRLAGGIAHDFNNYLTTIALYAQSLRSRPNLAAEVTGSTETILEQARGAARLVRQLLDFSRSSSVEKRPMDLAAFARSVADMLRRALSEEIDLAVEASGDDCVVEADRDRMEQMLMNLALNARDAMPQGGELQVRVSRIELGAEGEAPVGGMAPGSWIRLTVADTGVGLSDEARAHLFEPFFTTKEPGKGTGLGLSQVYGIVVQHGGHITVESGRGEGTTFRIYLPARSDPTRRPAVRHHGSLPKSKRKAETIMLVEDEEAVRSAGRELLQSLGYQVLTASNGSEALEVYGAARKVNLVLTDLVMPGMSGENLVKELRGLDPGLKALGMTGYALEQTADELREAGIVDIVEKPFDAGDLAQAVRHALDSS